MDDKFCSERNTLLKKVDEAFVYHKGAVRWLMEIEKFKNFHASESWRGGQGAELSEVAQKDYDEAVFNVIRTRRILEEARVELRRFDKEREREANGNI